MQKIWFVDVKQLDKKINNQYDFNHYVLSKEKNRIKDIVNTYNLKLIDKQCDIWIKNCRVRFLFNCIALIFAIIFIVLGLGLATGVLFDRKLLIVGIVFFLIGILTIIIYYLADNWGNPFMYKWMKLLESIKLELTNTSDLPTSIYYLYFCENTKEQTPNDFMFYLQYKTKAIPDKFKKYVNDQLEASVAGYHNNEHNFELDGYNYFKYWGNIQAIYEWAIFIKKLIKYVNN